MRIPHLKPPKDGALYFERPFLAGPASDPFPDLLPEISVAPQIRTSCPHPAPSNYPVQIGNYPKSAPNVGKYPSMILKNMAITPTSRGNYANIIGKCPMFRCTSKVQADSRRKKKEHHLERSPTNGTGKRTNTPMKPGFGAFTRLRRETRR